MRAAAAVDKLHQEAETRAALHAHRGQYRASVETAAVAWRRAAFGAPKAASAHELQTMRIGRRWNSLATALRRRKARSVATVNNAPPPTAAAHVANGDWQRVGCDGSSPRRTDQLWGTRRVFRAAARPGEQSGGGGWRGQPEQPGAASARNPAGSRCCGALKACTTEIYLQN